MGSEVTLLVVEDDPKILFGTVRLLRQAGYRVLEAETGLGAIEQARAHLPDMILLDIVLPDIDGFEVCRRLKENPPTEHIFICMLSAHRISSAEQSDGLDTGADEYLTRPIENRELLARVKAMVRLLTAERAQREHGALLAQQVNAQLAQLRIEETKFRLSFDNAAMGMAIVDQGAYFQSMNQATCHMLGRSEAELQKSTLFEVTNAAEAEMSTARFGRCLKDGAPYDLELTYRTPTGERRFALTSVSPVFSDDGDFQFAIVHFLDMTDRRQVEERCHYLFNAIPDDAFVLDNGWRYVYANKEVGNKLNRTPEELTGQRITAFYPQITTSPFWPAFETTMQRRAPTRTTAQFSFADGHDGWYEIRAFPIPEGILVISRDISAVRRLDEQIRRTQKMESIGTLAGGIAHDFNNILYAISGMSELLMDDLTAGSEAHENAEEILKAARRGSDLVKQILAVSRQSTHRLTPTPVALILLEVLKLARAAIPASTHIEQEIPPDCGFIMADSANVQQALMSIVTNAAQAVSSDRGRIQVALREAVMGNADHLEWELPPGRYAQIAISDNGHGMPPEVVEHIFDPYFTTRPHGKGTGLGLAVTYGIVKEHQGEIQVRSQVGKGTTFEVYLPLLDMSSTPDSVAPDQPFDTGDERILLVDDEAAIVRLEDQILTRLGYRVTCRTSSAEALAVFEADPAGFDLILTDMTMPQMPGDQLARKVKALRADIPIIICTGFSEKMDPDKAAAIGIAGFLKKPVSKAELSTMVRQALDGTKDDP